MTQKINDVIGQRLRLRRTIMGLSQEAIAKAVGITFQQVQKYEKGANALNANRLYEFAQLMHVPVAYFFEEMEKPMRVNNSRGLPAPDRESLEVMKAFKNIKNRKIRKCLADLTRSIADTN